MKKTLVTVVVAAAALAAAAQAAAPSLTLAASAPSVQYTKPVTLTGALSSKKTNQQVTIQAQECGKTTFSRVGNVKTTTNGAFSMSVTPTVMTVYEAKWKSTLSPKVTVSVRPLVQLVKVSRRSYTAKVTAGLDLKGKIVLFQRYSRLRHRWVQVKKVVLSTSTPGTKPTIVTSASFKAKVARRVRVRLMLSKKQAAPCYLSATSKSVRA
jgi:hypothetical protein